MGSYTTGCFFRRIVPVSGNVSGTCAADTHETIPPHKTSPQHVSPPAPLSWLSCHRHERHKQQIHHHYFARALCSLQHDIHHVQRQVASNSAALAGASNWNFASNATVYTYMSLEGYARKQSWITNGLAPGGGNNMVPPPPLTTPAAMARTPPPAPPPPPPPPALVLPLGDFHMRSNHTAPLYPCKFSNDPVLGGSTLRLVRTTTVPKQEDASGLLDLRKTDFKHSF
jgi:hypothetical protein